VHHAVILAIAQLSCDCRNLSVDEDEASCQRSRRHILQSIHTVRWTPGPGARPVPTRSTHPGGGGRWTTEAAARLTLRGWTVDHDETTPSTAPDVACRIRSTWWSLLDKHVASHIFGREAQGNLFFCGANIGADSTGAAGKVPRYPNPRHKRRANVNVSFCPGTVFPRPQF